MPVRKASAEWNGNLVNGKGSVSTESKTLDNTQYNFSSRFESGIGTNPEELVGAAHAACFSMALANSLAKGGFNPISVKTEDNVYIEKLETGLKITKIVVNCVANVEGIDNETFQKFAEDTKVGCIVSQALKGTEFILSAKLV
ncbi:MAG: peroxiredoxin [Chlorobiaceae bacterium]|nr:peroxiredoxin [Chlorobiaceae bacterium]